MCTLSEVSVNATVDGAYVFPMLEAQLAQVRTVQAGRMCLGWPAEGRIVVARAADGLLLQPVAGDVVLVAQIGDEWRVLMVLDRNPVAGPAVLSVPHVESLRVEAPRLSLHSHDLDVRAQRTTASLGVVRLSAQALRMAAQRVAVWADSLHTWARAVALRADMRVARIDGADVLHADKMLTEVDDLARLNGGQVQVGARENVLIDGKRISLG